MIYGVTIGSGKFADMALCQLRSIHEFTPASSDRIFGNCPPGEWEEIPAAKRREMEDLCVVHTRPLPLPEYPLSAFHATAKVCANAAETDEKVVLLDTDTLVFRDLSSVVSEDVSLALKPADFHPSRVGQSEQMVKRAFEAAGVDLPSTRVRSTVDGKTMPPYWNAGVIFARGEAVIERFVSLTTTLYEQFSDDFFLDQLALAATATEFNTQSLGEKFNFPLPQRLWTPSDTAVLHYHDPIELCWVGNPRIYASLRRIGIYRHVSVGSRRYHLKHLGIKFARLRLRR